MKAVYSLLSGIIFFGLILPCGCKTPPAAVPRTEPQAELIFENIEAPDPARVNLVFSLELQNPRQENSLVRMENHKITINERDVNSGSVFRLFNSAAESFIAASGTETAPGRTETGLFFSVPGGNETMPGIAKIPLLLELDLPVLTAAGISLLDEMNAELELDLVFAYDDAEASVRVKVRGNAIFVPVREPVFSITAIAILKAELINTRFRVTMKIDNPNPFPLDLSSFSYELYGNDLLWADGTEKNILSVPEKSSVLADLFLLMNFINMKRDLLDQIIRLEDVNYRFAGDVDVSTGIEYLPGFTSSFNLSGYSRVYDY